MEETHIIFCMTSFPGQQGWDTPPGMIPGKTVKKKGENAAVILFVNRNILDVVKRFFQEYTLCSGINNGMGNIPVGQDLLNIFYNGITIQFSVTVLMVKLPQFPGGIRHITVFLTDKKRK